MIRFEMYVLQKAAPLSIKSFPKIQKNKYCIKLNDFEKSHLMAVFQCHMESTFQHIPKDDRLEVTSSISCEIFNKAWLPHNYALAEKQVRKIISQSVPETMNKVICRLPGEKTGVMYEEEYFKIILEAQDGYMLHDQAARNGTMKRNYPCFTTGGTVNDLVKKNKVQASKAIASFFKGPTSADCGSAIEAVFFKVILDVLGEEKFNKLFDKEMKIHRYVNCSNKESNLTPFLEYMDPRISMITDEKKLLTGDHVMVTGTPWYSLKHPSGNMSNAHGVIVGFNQKKAPLVQALGMINYSRTSEDMLYYSSTMKEMKRMLMECSNEDQSKASLEYIEKYYGKNYLSDEHLQGRFKKYTNFKAFEKDLIFKKSTVKEAVKYGGCVLKNDDVTRLSSYVLAVLKEAPLDADLDHLLYYAKAEVLARQLFTSKQDFLNLLTSHRERKLP